MLNHAVKSAAAALGAVPDGLEQRFRLYPRLDSHSEHFGQGSLERVARAVVHQFRHRAASDGTDVIRLIPYAPKHGLVLLKGRLITTNPERELLRSCPLRSAANRGIEQLHAPFGENAMEPAYCGRSIRTKVKVRFSGTHAIQESRIAQRHSLYLWWGLEAT